MREELTKTRAFTRRKAKLENLDIVDVARCGMRMSGSRSHFVPGKARCVNAQISKKTTTADSAFG